MSTDALSARYKASQIARLDRLITWVIGASAAVALLQTALLVATPTSQTLISTLSIVISIALYRYARTQLRLGLLERAAGVVCAAMLGVIVVTILFTEGGAQTIVILVPVVIIVTGLPYLGRSQLRPLIFAVWGLMMATGVKEQLVMPGPLEGRLVEAVIAIVSLAIIAALLLFLVWQFSTRVWEMLADGEATNEALRGAQQRLEAEVEEAQRLRLQESEGRAQLDAAAEAYLAFVQALARGQSECRVAGRHAGILGQIARGLNGMAEDLERSQAESRRSFAAESGMRARLEEAVQGYLAFTRQVAAGELARRIEVPYDGALGELGHGLNAMVASLQRVSGEIRQASADIAASAAEILSATTQQAASASEQAASITQTTTTIEEVKVIAVQTAEQAQRVASDSQGALDLARQGIHVVDRTVSGMGVIQAHVGNIADTILALSEQAQVIGGIIVTVNELADQSNLLALNAAIEAARAGEQGKSFAVVAQHVRELAERSKQATAQVREILGEAQQMTTKAVLVTEEGAKGVQVGTSLAGQAGQAIHRIAAEVEGGAQASLQIATAAQQQTAGMEQIGQAMQSIQHATSQTLASTHQAARAAQDLNRLAQSLQSVVAMYQI